MQEMISAIIVAAGAGRRMNSAVKKQYMELATQPVLAMTLKAFEKSDVDEVVVVTGEDEVSYVREQIVEEFCIKKVVAICAGGRERCDSVYEGLKQIIKRYQMESGFQDDRSGAEQSAGDAKGYVLIHDGVRPLITPELINSCIESVKKYGACIPGVPEKDTVKEADDEMQVLRTPDRKKMYRIQTPQCFKLSLIKEAFEKYYQGKPAGENDKCVDDERDGLCGSAGITDDAMLVEKYTGHKIKIIEGDYKNIKITTPDDLGIAEYYIKHRDKV